MAKLDAHLRVQEEAASVWVARLPTEAAPVSPVMPRGYDDHNVYC